MQDIAELILFGLIYVIENNLLKQVLYIYIIYVQEFSSFINGSTNLIAEIVKIEECTDDVLIKGETEILFGNSIIQK